MCVVVCELSHTPPHLCLGRLISAIHKGGLCASQDAGRDRTSTCLATQSHTHAKRAFSFQNLHTKGDDIEENLVEPKNETTSLTSAMLAFIFVCNYFFFFFSRFTRSTWLLCASFSSVWVASASAHQWKIDFRCLARGSKQPFKPSSHWSHRDALWTKHAYVYPERMTFAFLSWPRNQHSEQNRRLPSVGGGRRGYLKLSSAYAGRLRSRANVFRRRQQKGPEWIIDRKGGKIYGGNNLGQGDSCKQGHMFVCM